MQKSIRNASTKTKVNINDFYKYGHDTTLGSRTGRRFDMLVNWHLLKTFPETWGHLLVTTVHDLLPFV